VKIYIQSSQFYHKELHMCTFRVHFTCLRVLYFVTFRLHCCIQAWSRWREYRECCCLERAKFETRSGLGFEGCLFY